MSNLIRASVMGAAGMVVATTLLAAPAQAATWLPTCNAPAGQSCVAVNNHSKKGSTALLSFRTLDGVCIGYKGDWGPGDIVGWPNTYVKSTDGWITKSAYGKPNCAGGEVSFVFSGNAYHRGAYNVQDVYTN